MGETSLGLLPEARVSTSLQVFAEGMHGLALAQLTHEIAWFMSTRLVQGALAVNACLAW